MSEARIRVWPAIKRGRIAPELYGLQLEMAGQCVYDGIWVGRTSRIPNEDGLRLDVLALLKHLRIPTLKWPGDDFASHYHWRDGVGTGAPRAIRLNPAAQQLEPNTFGTHEFMLLCEKVGCKPWLTCNSVTGSIREALDWVEYCTFGGETALASERSRNGSPEPFDVPYWSCSPSESGISPGQIHGDIVEISDRHKPTSPNQKEHLFPFPFCVWHTPDRTSSWRQFASACDEFRRFVAEKDQLSLPKLARFALAPWGTVHPEASPESGLEQPCTLDDALIMASSMHLFHEYADRIALAALAQGVNGHSCLIKTRGGELVLTALYYAMELLQPHKGAIAVYREVDFPSDASAVGAVLPALSVSASRLKKRLHITVAHAQDQGPRPLAVEIREGTVGSVTGRVLHGPTPGAENTFESPKTVGVSRIPVVIEDNMFRCELPPHSLACFSVVLK